MVGIGIVIGGAIIFAGRKIILMIGAIVMLLVGSISADVFVNDNPEDYTRYICVGTQGQETESLCFDETEGASIFPEKLDPQWRVLDYKYVYYNPWDAQRIAYLTVLLDNEEYAKEKERLSGAVMEDYCGIYSVTGEPKGYDLLAMDSDKYAGFTYAMIPEKENNTITYVAIDFCNYFLDLDINDYVPVEYLLEGFDATEDNPYRKENIK